MGNAERFLEEFNRLDHHFEYLLGGTKVSFIEKKNQLMRDGRYKHIIRRYSEDLEVINRLRNVVTHENFLGGRPLAEPREDIIERMAEIYEAVSKPMTVMDRMSAKSPKIFDYRDRLNKALKHMNENDFSQVVVQKDGRYSFLRREDTAKWLETNANGEIPSPDEVAIGEIMPKGMKHKFHISRGATVYDALAFFQENDEGYPALMITENGRETEMPLGIITPMDIIDFVSITAPSEY